ncbi:MAG: hypothetical protein WCA09_03925 [Burkholderiales bacterium]
MKTLRPAAMALTVPMLLAACYVLPVGPDGAPWYVYPPGVAPVAPVAASAPAPSGPLPMVLNARLYPENEVATQTGMLTGTVTNMMNGKGRFQLNYRGETLIGEATRVSNDERRGVASAYSRSGMFMSCDYQMASPRQGAGVCTFSDGAKYQVHLGS